MIAGSIGTGSREFECVCGGGCGSLIHWSRQCLTESWPIERLTESWPYMVVIPGGHPFCCHDPFGLVICSMR